MYTFECDIAECSMCVPLMLHCTGDHSKVGIGSPLVKCHILLRYFVFLLIHNEINFNSF